MVKNVVRVGKRYYDLDDPCLNTECSHAFECTSEGKTAINAYVQIGTQSLRECPFCGLMQKWELKHGKQGFNHKVDHDFKSRF